MWDNEKKVAIYCRTANKDSEARDSEAIEKQRLQLREFARQHGFTIVSEYADDGYNGLTLDRPAFRQMNEAIRAGGIDTVFVLDLSRISRNYVEYHRWREEMRKRHIFVASIHNGPI